MSTAGKWFVPADEYFGSIEDYAVVGESVLFVKNHLIDDIYYRDLDVYLPEDSEPKFIDVIDHHLYCGDLFSELDANEGPQLLYADVDRDNKEHQQLVKDAAKAGFVEAESKDVQEAKKRMLEYLNAPRHCCPSDKHELSASEREERTAAMNKALKSLEVEERMGSTGYIHKRMIEYFTEGVKEGWLIGYDFYANNIIIKPYHAVDGTEHPLAEKWDIELPDDGVSWKGHPAEFVLDKMGQLLKEIDNNKNSDQESKLKTEIYGFKLLAYHTVTRWLLRHRDPIASVGSSEGDVPEYNAHGLRVFCHTISEAAEKVPFPYKKQDKEKRPARPMPTFKYMQTLLEDYEGTVRQDALAAKKAGKEDVAQNVAKLYEQLLEQLRSFNLNPEKSL
ncbi:MAG: hypothetical protein L6R42_006591 [Xanthoria sp. 1 TBL-2021]|nr:MAG: hypothetical protein L6R42_006591 [Xanthoria sp. 1 TBL-2021]